MIFRKQCYDWNKKLKTFSHSLTDHVSFLAHSLLRP